MFHNRILGKSMYLGAVTVNQGPKRLWPQLAEEPASFIPEAAPVKTPPRHAAYLESKDQALYLGNSYIDLRIDLARGFAITHLTNRWLSGSIAMDSIQPGLELVVENKKVAVEDIKLAGVSQTNATATEKEATVTYTAQAAGAALELRISVSVNEDDPEVGLHLTALNCSAKELHAKILFPLFKASEMGNLDDVWYLYLNNDAEYHLRQSNTNGENHVHDNQT